MSTTTFISVRHRQMWQSRSELSDAAPKVCNLVDCRPRTVLAVKNPTIRRGEAVVRGLSRVLSMVAAGLGGLWILRDPEQQAWHDRIAGTHVVKLPREWPIVEWLFAQSR